MAKDRKKPGISRRDFLKASLGAGVGSGMLDLMAQDAMAVDGAWNVETADFSGNIKSTCTYCSCGCGLKLGVSDDVDGNGNKTEIADIVGDPASPINLGGLCAKGAATVQLVNSSQRLGQGTLGVGATSSNPLDFNVACKKTAAGSWTGISIDTALDEIALAMVTARGAYTNTAPGDDNFEGSQDSGTLQWTTAAKKKVAFFGSSHMNNEECYIYRKIIAAFGTQNTEHQARI